MAKFQTDTLPKFQTETLPVIGRNIPSFSTGTQKVPLHHAPGVAPSAQPRKTALFNRSERSLRISSSHSPMVTGSSRNLTINIEPAAFSTALSNSFPQSIHRLINWLIQRGQNLARYCSLLVQAVGHTNAFVPKPSKNASLTRTTPDDRRESLARRCGRGRR